MNNSERIVRELRWIKWLNGIVEVSPGWRESYTTPYIKGIKEELAKKK